MLNLLKPICVLLTAIMIFAVMPADAYAVSAPEPSDKSFSSKALEDYNSYDIGVINNIIANNGLKGYRQNDPYWWDFANWSEDATNKRLIELVLYDEGLTGTLDLSGCPNLEVLWCVNNRLTGINVSGCPNLEVLWCTNNSLTGINVSGCPNLETLLCDNNRLTAINLSGLNNLYALNVSNNQLTNLDLSGCGFLAYLECQNNRLTGINVSGCLDLEVLLCDNNRLTGINVSGCPALEVLWCDNNNLAKLNVSGLKWLQELDCSANKITSLNMYGCTALTSLNCGYNPIASLRLPDGYTLTIAPVTGIKVELDNFNLYTREVSLEATPSKAFAQWTISPSVKYTRGNQSSMYIRFIMPKSNVKVTPVKASSSAVKVTGVKLSKATLALNVGKSNTLKATVAPAKATNTKVTWKSSNTKVATVDSSGKVTAKAKGTATITVTTDDGKKTAKCVVTVGKVAAASVKMNKTSAAVKKGKTITLNATAAPTKTDPNTVTWTTSDKSVATVTSKGVVKGVSKGKATITAATWNGKKATCAVTVK